MLAEQAWRPASESDVCDHSIMESSVLNHQMPVTELIRGKKVIGYGAGLSLYQTQAALPLALAYVVDDAPGLAGTTACGVPVHSSERLSTENSAEIFVVIYADSPGAIFKIASSLDRLNLVWGEQYVDCALIHFESMAPRLTRLMGAPPSWQRFHRARIQRLSLMSPGSRSFIAVEPGCIRSCLITAPPGFRATLPSAECTRAATC